MTGDVSPVAMFYPKIRNTPIPPYNHNNTVTTTTTTTAPPNNHLHSAIGKHNIVCTAQCTPHFPFILHQIDEFSNVCGVSNVKMGKESNQQAGLKTNLKLCPTGDKVTDRCKMWSF